MAQLDAMPTPAPAVLRAGAPILLLERVLAPEFCRRLIEAWNAGDGAAHGVEVGASAAAHGVGVAVDKTVGR